MYTDGIYPKAQAQVQAQARAQAQAQAWAQDQAWAQAQVYRLPVLIRNKMVSVIVAFNFDSKVVNYQGEGDRSPHMLP